MKAFLALTVVAAAILTFELPRLIRQKKKKEMALFLALLFIAYGLGLLTKVGQVDLTAITDYMIRLFAFWPAT
ncbi:MAG: hypothetical protein PWQ91_290 [Eubacteriales bacterium]|nr:hypothetical protein [Eubacteriales bacterium]MDN5363229.1 hypothetical protein [Eubacteriales bacterium]